jgi:hypothetical protein
MKVRVLLKLRRSMNRPGVDLKTSRTQCEATTSTSLVVLLVTLTISQRCHPRIGQLMQVVGESSQLIPGAKDFSLQVVQPLHHRLNGYRLNYCEQRQKADVQQS